jgi:hypothetical protein
MAADKWLDLFKFGGTAVACLLFLAWCLIKLSKWIAEQIDWAKPRVAEVFERHVDTMDTVKAFCETLDSRLAQPHCPGSLSNQGHTQKLQDIHDDVRDVQRNMARRKPGGS